MDPPQTNTLTVRSPETEGVNENDNCSHVSAPDVIVSVKSLLSPNNKLSATSAAILTVNAVFVLRVHIDADTCVPASTYDSMNFGPNGLSSV